MKLDREQQAIADRIKRIGRAVGATPMEIKSALATGIVESGLRNLPGGDADSQGWRQERASLYKNPTNVDASIRRYFQETRAVRGKYATAGDLAAAVQRPAAQYRGRYAAVSDQAQKLLGDVGATPLSSPRPSNSITTTTGPSEAEQRNALLGDYLSNRGKPGSLIGLGVGLANVEAPATTTTRVPGAASTAAQATATTGELLELFWRGPGAVLAKNGQRVGRDFVSGHDRHVHVAADPQDIVRWAKVAQQMGLKVGENPAYGGVAPVHVQNSNHYASGNVGGKKVGKAIDVSGSPAKLRAFAHRVARSYGVK